MLPTPDTEDEEVCTGPLAGLPLPGGGTTVPFIGALPVQQQLDLLAPLLEQLAIELGGSAAGAVRHALTRLTPKPRDASAESVHVRW